MSFSQIYELGFTYGKSNFIGDVGNTTFINPSENTFGAVFKWNRSSRHSYRMSYIMTTPNTSNTGPDFPHNCQPNADDSKSCKQFLSTSSPYNSAHCIFVSNNYRRHTL